MNWKFTPLWYPDNDWLQDKLEITLLANKPIFCVKQYWLRTELLASGRYHYWVIYKIDITIFLLVVVAVEFFSWGRWSSCHFQDTNCLNSLLLKSSLRISCSVVLRALFWDGKWQSGKEGWDTSVEIFKHTWKWVKKGFQSTLSPFKNPTQIAIAISGKCLLFCY